MPSTGWHERPSGPCRSPTLRQQRRIGGDQNVQTGAGPSNAYPANARAGGSGDAAHNASAVTRGPPTGHHSGTARLQCNEIAVAALPRGDIPGRYM